MCFSYPDTSLELWTQTQVSLMVPHGWLMDIVSSLGPKQLLVFLPPNRFLLQPPHFSLPVLQAPKPGLVLNPSLAFTSKPASSTIDTTQNLPTSCHLHNFHHLVSGPVPPGTAGFRPYPLHQHRLFRPWPPEGACERGIRSRPFLLRGNPPGSHQAQGKSPTPSSPQDPVNLPPSPKLSSFHPHTGLPTVP